MAKINVNDEKYLKDERTLPNEGRKVLYVVGYQKEKSAAGDMFRLGFTIVDDLDNPDGKKSEDGLADVGMDARGSFKLSARATKFFVRFVRAIGWTEEVDTDNEDQIRKIFTKGPVIGTIHHETYENNGKTYTTARVENFEPYAGEIDPAWEEICDEGARRYDEQAAAREEREKAQKSRQGNFGGGGQRRSSSVPF